MAFQKENLGTLLTAYEAAREWLAELCGERRIQLSRFGRYSEDLGHASSRILAGKTIDVDQMPLYLTALEEAQYLVRIHQGLDGYEPQDELTAALGFVLQGAHDRADDKVDNEARNKAFELSVAAQLSASGAEIDLSDVTDIISVVDRVEFLIECKRPRSMKAIGDNYRGANRQIRRRLDDHPGAAGIVALSASVAIVPARNYLRADTLEDLEKAIKSMQGKFDEAVTETVTRFHRHGRVPRGNIGVMTELCFLAGLGEEHLPTTVRDILLHPTWSANDPIALLGERLGAVRVRTPYD